MTALAWDDRVEVVQNLFNPAFCGLLISEAVTAYNDVGMDLALSFLILPLVLHRDIRKSLPTGGRTTLPVWVQEHPDLVIQFPGIVRELRTFTSEAILWAINGKRIGVSQLDSRLISIAPAVKIERLPEDRFGEIGDCVHRARGVGKWFARAGSTSTIFGVLGVRP